MAWHNQGWRHSLAARRIKTRLNGPIYDYTRHGIPITVQSPADYGRKYPVAPSDVKEVMDQMPKKDVEGITEINLRNPSPVAGTKQDKAWAQYVRSKKRVNIFSQPYQNGSYKDVEPGNNSPSQAKEHMEEYVIPHEVGHHVAAQKNPNLPIIVEEAKADAFAARENPDDKKVLEKHINQRVMMFGSKGTI